MTPLAKHLTSRLGDRTYAEVAAALGVRRQTAAAWFRDTVPSYAHLGALCDVLGMSDVALDTAIVLAEREIAERAMSRWRSS